MAVTTKQQRQQRRSEALQLIADGVPPTDAATQLSQTWGCSRRTSLRDIELAQSELATALDSSDIRAMVGWLATQYQRLAAKAERDGQYAAACGALNSLRVCWCSHSWIGNLKRTSVVALRTRCTGVNNVHKRYRCEQAVPTMQNTVLPYGLL